MVASKLKQSLALIWIMDQDDVCGASGGLLLSQYLRHQVLHSLVFDLTVVVIGEATLQYCVKSSDTAITPTSDFGLGSKNILGFSTFVSDGQIVPKIIPCEPGF